MPHPEAGGGMDPAVRPDQGRGHVPHLRIGEMGTASGFFPRDSLGTHPAGLQQSTGTQLMQRW
ncbi:hypothetical protein HMPREF3038_02284 [Akkermansia sp. KLE1797]|nr:hypothetical protein HMPREF3038_02284 [Akkermansia sp. KLE1797]KXU53654.1 hypothetical protein HMPREF3039_02186 [Akkermansia sp. KLE1798]KZA03861.1 hypothetical protein HMPREF1326_02401 [Akkermansia sp. KLE1605]